MRKAELFTWNKSAISFLNEWILYTYVQQHVLLVVLSTENNAIKFAQPKWR